MQGGWIGRASLDDGQPATSQVSALEKYVRFDDGKFAWTLMKETRIENVTYYQIRLTSQQWRTEKDVDRPIWKHWLTVAVPDTVRFRTPMLAIGGGRHREEPPEKMPGELLGLAKISGSVVVYLDNVPNQPLRFEGESEERYEDNLLARSWVLAMRDDDANWIGRFAMVKSAVTAMDATEQFLKELAAKEEAKTASGTVPTQEKRTQFLTPDGFFVLGGSKRGWTTWLTGAVDARVKGIAPIVIDVLNMAEHTPHHYRSYGFWAPALADYEKNGIAAKFGTPELAKVTAHEDPLFYLSRVERLPKYIMNAGGDEFFPTDSLRHYENRLSGVWRARVQPNAGHSLAGTQALAEVTAFYHQVVMGKPFPEVSWVCQPGALTGSGQDVLTVRTNQKPTGVQLWRVDNPKARDFRLEQTGATWTTMSVPEASADGMRFEAKIEKPASGYRAYMVACTFPNALGEPLVFTTRVFITPDTLPFELPKRP